MKRFKRICFAVSLIFASAGCLMSHAQQSAKSAASEIATCEKCPEGKCQCGSSVDAVSTKAKTSSAENETLKSSHVQTSTFTPQINEQDALLSTFRVSENGNIVACVSPQRKHIRRGAKTETQGADYAGYVQVYSPELELLKEFGLSFLPTALDLDKSGNMFVGGGGSVYKLSEAGELLAKCESPNQAGVDLEKLKQKIRDDLDKQQKQLKKSFERQIASLTERIDELKESVEDGEELKKRDARKLKRLEKQLKDTAAYLEQNSEVSDEQVDAQLNRSTRVTAIAVTEKDLFVATSSQAGFGYEVYRFDQDIENGEKVLNGLRGCCGQMDIHAVEDRVAVAENTNYNVAVYDREGNELSRFGERLSGDNQGFGSCCNPMNVLCCPNGDYLTAESSVGKIKRFNADGELIGYVGDAKIGGGCKHVAIGFDTNLDRYYVQHEDSNTICVLNKKPTQDVKSEDKIDSTAGEN